MDLKELRNKIDLADDKLMQAYMERVRLAELVGEYKKRRNMEVLNSDREQEIYRRLIQKYGKEYEQDIYSVYSAIMSMSRLRQARQGATENIFQLFELEEGQDNFKDAKTAVQGVEGAYSMQAAEEMFRSPKISYHKSFADVFEQVAAGKADYGVVPIENSNAGSVNEVYDLLSKFKLYIAKAKRLKISHCLAAAEGADIKGINTVISHSQALYQCKDFIKKQGWKQEHADNTAEAAKAVAKERSKHKAAIASLRAAKLYGLKILKENIQDQQNNDTRFIAITRRNLIRKEGNKISLVANLEHKKGSLFELLNIISSCQANMTKLESRPIPGSSFEFQFYVDIEGNILDKRVQNMLFDINNYARKTVFLGGYTEE